MAARQQKSEIEGHPATSADVNEVRVVGRLAERAAERELPSGDRLVTFRLVVRRPEGGPSRQRVDALECAAWSARVRRSAVAWRPGDVVEVTGAVRRRFYRGTAATASRVEIEVVSGRLVRRATSA
jgi:single-strand DNA-binding protein